MNEKVCQGKKRGRDIMKRMNDFLAGLPMTMVGGVFLVISFVLLRTGIDLPMDPAWITVMICGIPLFYLAVWRIIHNKGISKISSALLITVAMFAAIAIGDLFAAGEVAFIMEIGAILEDMTTDRAKKGLQKLISIAPVQGRKITTNGEEMVEVEKIQRNDVLRVLPGEAIPVDGVIISGETSVDQSVMTGESLPVEKGVGEEVFCGTINRFGVIDMKATKVGEDSSLQKLIRMVQDAEEKQAPMQRIADKCASWLVPVALPITVIAGIFTQDIVRAVTVLVVFCPCALVLATPTAIMAAIGQATKHGVIIAADTHCIGILALSDVLRPEAKEVICKLSARKVKTILLTGDNKKTADYFASQAGIATVKAELLPEEKVESIVQIQENGSQVCMIGDGVNDAPALKAANVGVAMGSMGSDIAVEAADIALMSDDISKILY